VIGFLATAAPPGPPEPVRAKEPAPARPALPAADPTFVCVVGPDQRPLPGVEVFVEQGTGAAREALAAVTGPDGEAAFAGVQLGEARLVGLRQPIEGAGDGLAPPYLDLTPPARTLRAHWTQVAAAGLVGAHIELVDAESGETLEHAGFEWRGAGQAGRVAPGRGPTRLHLPARAGELLSLDVKAAPLTGYVQWEQGHYVDRVSAYSKVVAIRVPLRRALPLHVRARGPDGAPVTDAKIRQIQFGDRILNEPDATIDAYGVVHSTVLPALRGEPVVVHIGSDALGMGGSVTARIPEAPGAPLEVDVTLTRSGGVGIGGGAGGLFRDRCGKAVTRAAGPVPETAEYAEVHVEVLRHDGQPAVGADVYLSGQTHTTDDMGRVRFLDPREGRNHVHAVQRGLHAISHTVHVISGEHVHVSVQEPKGRQLDVEVVDESGEPLPYARLEPGASWFDEVAGTQLADRYVDHLGRRRFARLSPYVRSFQVSFGTRKLWVEVPEPGQGTLRVVLPAPESRP
jgi:hypothetical protein